jgi:hypothetical protein
MSQTSPRSSFCGRAMDSREKSSEWLQFHANLRVSEDVAPRADRRTVMNPTLTLSATLDELSAANKLGGAVSASATPHTTQHSQGLAHPGSAHMPTLRCESPSGALDNLSVTTRSVPATPLSSINGTAAHLRTLGTPRTPGKALPLKSAPKVLFRPTRIPLMLAICKPHCLACPRVSMKIVRYHSTRSRLDTRTPSK